MICAYVVSAASVAIVFLTARENAARWSPPRAEDIVAFNVSASWAIVLTSGVKLLLFSRLQDLGEAGTEMRQDVDIGHGNVCRDLRPCVLVRSGGRFLHAPVCQALAHG